MKWVSEEVIWGANRAIMCSNKFLLLFVTAATMEDSLEFCRMDFTTAAVVRQISLQFSTAVV